MIIKLDPLKTSYSPDNLIHHLLEKPEDNEEITLVQGSGERIKQDYQMSKLALCPDAVLHVKLSPDQNYHMTPDDWKRCLDDIAKEFKIDPALATVVQHKKKGRVHQHIVFPAFDFAANKKYNIFRYKMRCQKLAKTLEKSLKHEPTPLGYYGQQHVAEMLEHEGNFELADELLASKTSTSRGFTSADAQKAKRYGYDASILKEQFTQLLEQSDNEKAYQAALKELGFTLVLVKGKRARYEFHSIKEPKLTLNATRLLKVSKQTLIKHLNGDYRHENTIHKQHPQNAFQTGTKTAQTFTSSQHRQKRERTTAKPEILRETGSSHTPTATTASGNQPRNRQSKEPLTTTRDRRTITDRTATGSTREHIAIPTAATRTNTGYERKNGHTVRRYKTPSELAEQLKTAISPAEQLKALYRLNSSLKIKPAPFCTVDPNIQLSQELSTKILGYYSWRLGFRNSNLLSCTSITNTDNAHLLITTKTHHQYRDYGNKITSPSDIDTRTAQEIVKTLKNRGCKFVNITGTNEYKDEIAIQCALNGIPCNHELSKDALIKYARIKEKLDSNRLQRLRKQQQVILENTEFLNIN